MKIAVTGGSGFIGSWFTRLYKEQYEIIVLGRNNNFFTPGNADSFVLKNTDYSLGSFMNCLGGVECVLHLAAQKIDNDCELDAYVNSNILLTRNLFEACRMLNIKNIINISSRLVYSEADILPWCEAREPHPTTYYGISKLAAEKLAHLYNDRYDLNIKTLRLAQVLGWGDQQQGEFVVTKFIAAAAKKETLTIYGKGAGKREYIYIKDAVSAIDCAIRNRVKSGVYNIGSGVNISYKELAVLINQVFNNVGNLVYAEEKPEDNSTGLMNIKKAEYDLGFLPQWSLERTLTEMKETKS